MKEFISLPGVQILKLVNDKGVIIAIGTQADLDWARKTYVGRASKKKLTVLPA